MIRLDTINTLCMYLNVTPADFFEYLPINISFETAINSVDYDLVIENDGKCCLNIKEIDADVFLDVEKKTMKSTYELSIKLEEEINMPMFSEESIHDMTVKASVFFENMEDVGNFSDIREELQFTFHREIYINLVSNFDSAFLSYYENELLPNIVTDYVVDTKKEDEYENILKTLKLEKKVINTTIFSDMFLPF